MSCIQHEGVIESSVIWKRDN